MKRLLAAFAIASMLTAAPAVADYRACMEFCTEEHAFRHCNDVCSGQAANRPGPSSGAQKAGEPQPPIPEVLKGMDCSTWECKTDALLEYIVETYEAWSGTVLPEDLETEGIGPTTFEGSYYQDHKKQECSELMTITDDCRVSIKDRKCEFADKFAVE